jgi:hypothetical protein
MEIIQRKARDVKSGETVIDRGTRFTIKEVRVSAEHGPIALIDMEGVWHGVYHPDEYLGKVILPVPLTQPRDRDRWMNSASNMSKPATKGGI